MIADSRFDAFVENFAGQWLYPAQPGRRPSRCNRASPTSTTRCARHSARETELFFESIVREDRSALDLLRADYTFLNERLARHYGIAQRQGQPLPPRDTPVGQPTAAACSVRAAFSP